MAWWTRACGTGTHIRLKKFEKVGEREGGVPAKKREGKNTTAIESLSGLEVSFQDRRVKPYCGRR